ncbi:putative FAD-linked oxidoreductase [Cladobotryum mycophilum]|uniref:FAD-linked oxidoreductase n=1 Tax=Cladobotryum mycophilum TaxID=491253 RepID=A0ABR0SUP0_9HYPO
MSLNICQPEQSCWPIIAQWQAFNQTISGCLKITVPVSSVCFPSSPNFNIPARDNVKDNYTNNTFRKSTYRALQGTEWKSYGARNYFYGVGGPEGSTYSLGQLSALYVNAQEASKITAAIQFIQSHGIRIVVNNTGHYYLGHSTTTNTLAIRTYNLKNLDFQSSFTASNCAAANKQKIGTIGAGIMAQEVNKSLFKSKIPDYNVLAPTPVSFLEILSAAGDPLTELKSLTSSNTLLSNHAEQFPSSRWRCPSQITTLVSSVLKAIDTVSEQFGQELNILHKTAPVNTPDTAQATSAKLAWRNALQHMIVPDVSEPNAATSASAPIASAVCAVIDVIKMTSRVSSIGVNYDKIVQVKQTYDQQTVLNCKKCIGYLGDQNPMHSCYSDSPVPSVPYPFA